MSERKSFLLRIDRDTLDAVQRWANDDLRSLNGQIEFLLRRALQSTGRTLGGAPVAGAPTTDASPADLAAGNPAPPSDGSNRTNFDDRTD